MSEPLLDIEDLVVTYGAGDTAKVALDHVSLRLEKGQFTAVVGESGSGKTTLANVVVGLLPESAHTHATTAVLDGHGILGLSERQWSGLRGSTVGLVPQDPGASLNPVRTIGAQLAEVFELRNLKLSRSEVRRRSIELLEQVEIDNPERRLRQYPGELSGGMRQRVLIAIAFGLNPKLLVADEPTSALDVTVQSQVLRVLDRLVAEHGTTVLFVTHDIGVATDHASRIVVMRDGRVVEQGDVESVVTEPRSEYTRTLIGRIREVTPPAPLPTRTDSDEVVRVSAITKEFRVKGRIVHRAVDGVDLSVRRGETVALVGESGSGKSTTAKMIIGLTTPTGGTVEVLGRNVARLGHRERRHHWREVQFVYQNPDSALDPRWSIRQILDEPLRSFGIGDAALRKQRIEQALGSVNLPAGSLDKYAAELSGGQRQRVAIARALVVRPEIVILDEPLSALDVVTQDQIIALLIDLQRNLDLTYLFISHDLAVVRQISHRVAVLRSGRLVEFGDTQRVFDEPSSEYTRNLIDSVPGQRFRSSLLVGA
ncbi:dipeptide ABC transporter ATP-binding protein [Rhodococcus sp. NPDC003382]|uniref:ABC transporter ATP-binding protein n=2 Tax=Rhodococcus TaxID=1827 RepID=A0AA46WZ83_RHORH|nr:MULTISPECIES: ABC transporter ATP-binding protein [Rhodococcus]MCK8674026.1 ABC transporter ATP-binding protein [Rhodococcus sp. HM1]UZF46690.1 ABC transporter ATP-binding protein [Rhodococcus rhodochrous]